MTQEQLRMQMLSGVITESEYKTKLEELNAAESKDSLNEHYIAGGIVGIRAINQIPSREKSDYEMAFEHFLGERYETKFENREQDIEEGKEVEEPSLYEEELEENIFQGEDVMPKFRAGVLKQLIAYAEKEGSSKESIDDLKAALAKIEAEIEAEKNKKPLPR